MHFVKSEELKDMATREAVVAAAARFMGADPNEPVPQEALQEELNTHSRGEKTVSSEHQQCMVSFSKPSGYLSACNHRLAELLGDDKWLWA